MRKRRSIQDILDAWAKLTPQQRGAIRERRLALWQETIDQQNCGFTAGLPGDWENMGQGRPRPTA